MSLEMGILAGVAAGAATALRSVRTALANMSSVLVIQTTVLTPVGSNQAMRAFLQLARPIQTGIKGFRLQRHYRRSKAAVVVPWVDEQASGFAIYKRAIIRYKLTNGDFKIYSLRWLTDVDNLVCSIAEQLEILSASQTKGRYEIQDILGADGKALVQNPNTLVARGNDQPDHPTPEASSEGFVSGDRFLRFSQISDFQDTDDSDPFELLSYPECVMAEVEKIKKWSHRRDWYVSKGLPYRRGWLLHGPGGTGKSTLVVAVAQLLGVTVFRFFLGTLSDQEFLRQWAKVSSQRCIILFEDFDGVFHGRKNVSGSTLTFDVLLNAISGVSPADGVLLIITTNRVECIDPALGVNSEGAISTRPGRIDSITYVGPLEEPQIRAVAGRMLGEWPDELESVVQKALALRGCTGAQVRELCVQRAFELQE